MIQANELRIGNLVYADGEECEICSIVHEDKGYSYWVKKISDSSCHYINDIEPIPLTRDRILMYRFSSKEDDCNILCKDGVEVILFEEIHTICSFPTEDGVICKSLHQLQNLYFALIGKELS